MRRHLKSVPFARPAWRLLRERLFGPHREQIFSIGRYDGRSPFSLSPSTGTANPILQASDVTDLEAKFVADPFVFSLGDVWYLFFEVLPKERLSGHQDGVIAVATSSDKGLTWEYERVVLKEPFHLSYPHVFEADGEIFMVPETHQARSIRLYRAVEFPWSWEFVSKLATGDFVDASPFYARGSWWMFAEAVPPGTRWRGVRARSALRLFYADSVVGPWHEHPMSPVVEGEARMTRPAGRVIESEDGRLFRFAQDCSKDYGAAVYAREVLTLTHDEYVERSVGEEPLLGGTGRGWNAGGMHHLDAHFTGSGWAAFVDGWYFR